MVRFLGVLALGGFVILVFHTMVRGLTPKRLPPPRRPSPRPWPRGLRLEPIVVPTPAFRCNGYHHH
jgi:hypothetical protein